MSTQALDNPHHPGGISHDEVTVAVSESSLLVPLAKSKKLAAIRKRSQSLQMIENIPVQTEEMPSLHTWLLLNQRDLSLSKAWIILVTIPSQGKPVLHDRKTG